MKLLSESAAKSVIGIMLFGCLLWAGTAFILACDSGTTPTIPWEDLDDDGDGVRNGDDLWPFDWRRH